MTDATAPSTPGGFSAAEVTGGTPAPAPAPWSAATRIAFRCAFAYFLWFMLVPGHGSMLFELAYIPFLENRCFGSSERRNGLSTTSSSGPALTWHTCRVPPLPFTPSVLPTPRSTGSPRSWA